MKCFFTGLTDPGLLRSSNQDYYYIDPHGRFFIVADGMGGHAGGQEASRIATQAIQAHLNEHWDSDLTSPQMLRAALVLANREIVKDQQQHPERSDMGTTIVVLLFREETLPEGDKVEEVWCAHVGDSRLYRLRGYDLEQLTEDHTWVAQAMRTGEMTADQARTHPWRHVLSQCLGREDLAEVTIQRLDLHPADRLLLCSDGLTEELSDQTIASYLKSIRASEKAVASLVNAAKEKGGKDNITVVLVTVDNFPRPELTIDLKSAPPV